MRKIPTILLGVVVMLLVACSTSQSIRSNEAPEVRLNDSWVLLPSINNTEVPQAGGRLDSIAASVLRVHGVSLMLYSSLQTNADGGNDGIFDAADRHSQDQAMAVARKQGARYAVAGSVDEWRYKSGLESAPAAGISLNIIDLHSGQVIWSGSAAKTGSSSQAISALVQDLVDRLLRDALSRATTSKTVAR